MFGRLSLKSVLLGGCCLVLPISYATGDNAVTSPLGTVVPVGISSQAVAVLPQTVPVSAPVAMLQAAATPQVPGAGALSGLSPMPVVPAAPQAQPSVVPVAPLAPATASLPTPPQRPPIVPGAPSIAPPASSLTATAPGQLMTRTTSNPQPSNAAAQSEATVDETALRYYATQRDLKRLGAEIRRLKALYPAWEAPEDLFDQPTNISEQPLWDMFGRGDYAGVHNQIARLQGDNPNWKPSADLNAKLALAETRTLMQRSFAQRNWHQVIELAEATPGLMVCQEMNVIWLTAESLARSQDFARASDLYTYVLSTCDNRSERLATVQKASQLLPEANFTRLVMLGQPSDDGRSEFEAVSFDPLRNRMGSVAQGTAPVGNLPVDQLQRFAEFTQRTASAADASLFGWYYYSQKNWDASYQWFVFASHLVNDPKSLEGIILTMRNLDRRNEAIALAKTNAELTPEISKIYIELVADAMTDEKPLGMKSEDLEAFETLVLDHESALGAQALGWYLLSQKNTAEASRLFDKSVLFEATEGGVVGQAVIAARGKRWSTVSAIKAKYGAQFDGLSDVKVYQAKYAPRKIKRLKKEEKPDLLTRLFGNSKRSSKEYAQN